MVTTSRTYYEPAFKVKVLDHARVLGSVSDAARRHQLEPGLVYSWKANEKEIRKTARKAGVTATAPKSNGSKGPPPPQVSPPVVKRALPEPPHPDGPEVAVRALGPWLEAVVKRELPAAMNPELESLVRDKFTELEGKLTELVRAEFKAFVSKGVG